jgi:hypothetical protein
MQRLYHYSLDKYVSSTCKWTFDHYVPSLWEKFWHDNIGTFQNSVCPTLMQSDQLNKSIVTLEFIIESQRKIANQSFSSKKYDRLLSKMYYQYSCSGSPRLIVSQYIEPLIGLLRDPLTICSPPAIPPSLVIVGDSIQSKRFFLLGPSASYQNFEKPQTSIVPWLRAPGAQTILFDLGASLFGDMQDVTLTSTGLSTRWFYEYFRSKSLYLDHIIAFEVSPFAPLSYWRQIPDDIIGKLTFINTGVEATGKFNPWNILKSIAKPEDYVIIKLDIDTPEIEGPLADQVANDTSVSSLIDEMFFEMHITVNEMRGHWGNPPGELKDTYALFRKLRSLGIRMHSWP